MVLLAIYIVYRKYKVNRLDQSTPAPIMRAVPEDPPLTWRDQTCSVSDRNFPSSR